MMTSLESDEQFKLIWEKLVAEEPITCTKTQEVLPALPKPDAVIIDVSRNEVQNYCVFDC